MIVSRCLLGVIPWTPAGDGRRPSNSWFHDISKQPTGPGEILFWTNAKHPNFQHFPFLEKSNEKNPFIEKSSSFSWWKVEIRWTSLRFPRFLGRFSSLFPITSEAHELGHAASRLGKNSMGVSFGWSHFEVVISWNRDTPKSSIYRWVVHYKPSIFGYTHFRTVCIHIYICTYVHMYICTYVHMYICTYVHMYICTYVYMYICIYVYMYICIYAYMYICIYVYIYIICIYEFFPYSQSVFLLSYLIKHVWIVNLFNKYGS